MNNQNKGYNFEMAPKKRRFNQEPAGRQSTGLLDLPDEILAHIITFVEPISRQRLRQIHSRLLWIIDSWFQGFLHLRHAFLDGQTAPISFLRHNERKFDWVSFDNIQLGENFEEFLGRACGSARKVTLKQEVAVDKELLRIISRCEGIRELEILEGTWIIETQEDKDVMQRLFMNLESLKLSCMFYCPNRELKIIPSMLEWVTQGNLTTFQLLKLPNTLFSEMNLERFYATKRDRLKGFFLDPGVHGVKPQSLISDLRTCNHLEDLRLCQMDWHSLINFSKGLTLKSLIFSASSYGVHSISEFIRHHKALEVDYWGLNRLEFDQI